MIGQPITPALLLRKCPAFTALEPNVRGQVVDGLNELLGSAALLVPRGEDPERMRDTMCGFVLATDAAYKARIIPRDQCAQECKDNGMPEESYWGLSEPPSPGTFTMVVVTDPTVIVFELPVMLIPLPKHGRGTN